jgi:hypothetical protein
MSERADTFKTVLDFVDSHHLDHIFGASGLSDDKKYYYTTLSIARNMDGEVKVYSPKFIQIKWQTRYHILPQSGSLIFDSVDNVLAFLRLAFVEFDEAANYVPTKPTRSCKEDREA